MTLALGARPDAGHRPPGRRPRPDRHPRPARADVHQRAPHRSRPATRPPGCAAAAVRLHVRAGDRDRARAARRVQPHGRGRSTRRSRRTTSPEDRQALLDDVLPSLSERRADDPPRARPGALGAAPDRGGARPRRHGAKRAARHAEVARRGSGLSAQMAGGLSNDERVLAAELIAPLLVANSSFSAELTKQEQDRQAAAVQPVVEEHPPGPGDRPRGHAGHRRRTSPESAPSASTCSRPDLAALGGWLLLSGLMVALADRLAADVPAVVLAPEQRRAAGLAADHDRDRSRCS